MAIHDGAGCEDCGGTGVARREFAGGALARGGAPGARAESGVNGLILLEPGVRHHVGITSVLRRYRWAGFAGMPGMKAPDGGCCGEWRGMAGGGGAAGGEGGGGVASGPGAR